jgi:hypothetical protein
MGYIRARQHSRTSLHRDSYHLRYCCHYLFLNTVSSLHLKMPATELYINIKFSVSLYKSPLETLQML